MAAYTTIDDSEAYFQTVIYTGGQSGGGMKTQAVTFDGENDMSPNMVWIKSRSNTYNHVLADSVRGVDEILHPNTTAAALDGVADSSGGVSIFGSNGFTAAGNDVAWVAESPSTYVAWCWKESATAGLDIVTWTGNATNRDITHNLGVAPLMVIIKNKSTTVNWSVSHQPLSASLGDYSRHITLDSTAAISGINNVQYQDAAFTSSVFKVGTGDTTNKNTDAFVGYIFAPVQGFSKFGTYEGNGNADGAFVYTGFRPAFVMTKSADSSSSWHMFDNKREGYNVDNDPLVADATTVEATTDMIDLLSNGFKIRISTDPNVAETYIYAAFAEAPFVNSNGVPCNAR